MPKPTIPILAVRAAMQVLKIAPKEFDLLEYMRTKYQPPSPEHTAGAITAYGHMPTSENIFAMQMATEAAMLTIATFHSALQNRQEIS